MSKFKMLSRHPYSAIKCDSTKNPIFLKTPDGISFRNWKKGLENRWGSIFELDLSDEDRGVVRKWLRDNEVEYSMTYSGGRKNLFYMSHENAIYTACALKGATKED